ncbi:PREDICTED: glycine-rich cell wall structural protein-like isoform X1 [Nicotiana attenuata]|uniref:glycine-rich cell wall structural protein-like isoform X1 n=1 Tax=Nicotiana attenuata TaxID=49451 RepID=UPI0009052A90|nr:PREDICTED: glycine-rich cell wall structural protein-like isoform X1 [Nicotiana attenuata]
MKLSSSLLLLALLCASLFLASTLAVDEKSQHEKKVSCCMYVATNEGQTTVQLDAAKQGQGGYEGGGRGGYGGGGYGGGGHGGGGYGGGGHGGGSGGHGGYGGGGHGGGGHGGGGHGGGCRNGCCGGYGRGGGCRCCSTAQEALAYMQKEANRP